MATPKQHQSSTARQTLPASALSTSASNSDSGTRRTQQGGQQQARSQAGPPSSDIPIGSPQTTDVGRSIWAKAGNNAIILLSAAVSLAVAYIFGKIAARQGDSNLRATLWRDCVDLPEKTGDTVTCKKLLAGGFHSLVSKQRAEQSLSSSVRQGDNNLVYFWQELCLIEDRFVLEPLLWTMLLAADLTPRLAFLGLILARVMVTEHVLESAGMTICLSAGVQWVHMAMSLNATFIHGSDLRSVVEVMVEINRYVLLAGSIAMLIQRLRPRSIRDFFDTGATRSQIVWPPARMSVIYFCILSLVVLKWPRPNSYGFNIDHELVLRWKQDHTEVLCGQLTAFLISILILRIPYTRIFIKGLASELMDCCLLVISAGCIKMAEIFLEVLITSFSGSLWCGYLALRE